VNTNENFFFKFILGVFSKTIVLFCVALTFAKEDDFFAGFILFYFLFFVFFYSKFCFILFFKVIQTSICYSVFRLVFLELWLAPSWLIGCRMDGSRSSFQWGNGFMICYFIFIHLIYSFSIFLFLLLIYFLFLIFLSFCFDFNFFIIIVIIIIFIWISF